MNEPVIICRVRDYRLQRKLTQEDLAHSLGVSRQSVISIEAGRAIPSLRFALLLSEFLAVPFEDLFLDNTDGAAEHLSGQNFSAPLLQDDSAVVPLNLHKDEKNVLVEAFVPGYKEKELAISLNADTLTIHGQPKSLPTKQMEVVLAEFVAQPFERSITLPRDADVEHATAELKDGVLTIKIPRRPLENQTPRTIKLS